MELMMYLGNDFIESVALDRELISKPGYLGHFKRQLKLKHLSLLQQSTDLPEFLVVDAQPAAQVSAQQPFSLS